MQKCRDASIIKLELENIKMLGGKSMITSKLEDFARELNDASTGATRKEEIFGKIGGNENQGQILLYSAEHGLQETF